MAILKLQAFKATADVNGQVREVAWDEASGLSIRGLGLEEAQQLLFLISTGSVKGNEPYLAHKKAAEQILAAPEDITLTAPPAVPTAPTAPSSKKPSPVAAVPPAPVAAPEPATSGSVPAAAEDAAPVERPAARRRRAAAPEAVTEAAEAPSEEAPPARVSAGSATGNGKAAAANAATDPWGLTPEGERVDVETLAVLQEQSSFKAVLQILQKEGHGSRKGLLRICTVLQDQVSAISRAEGIEARIDRFCTINGLD